MVSKSLGASQATGLSQQAAEPVSRLGPSGFDPSRYLSAATVMLFSEGHRHVVELTFEHRDGAERTLDWIEWLAGSSLPNAALLEQALERVFGVTDLYMDIFGAECRARLAEAKAIAMEARRGETPQSGSTAEGGDSAGRNGIAQTQAASDAPASAQSSTSIDARRAQERK